MSSVTQINLSTNAPGFGNISEASLHRPSVCAPDNLPVCEGIGPEILRLEKALDQWDRTSTPPPAEQIIQVLQKCRKSPNPASAKRLHAIIRNNSLETHELVGNYLVPMLAECAGLSDALQVLDKMQKGCMRPNVYTIHAILRSCTKSKCFERGWEMHNLIAKEAFESDPFVGSALVNMYAKFGFLAEARDVFDELPVRDVVSWTALIAAYAECGTSEEVLEALEKMQLEGVCPDAVTFVCSLRACGTIRAIQRGHDIHSEIIKLGFESDDYISSTLVDMYAKCGLIAEAQAVFHTASGGNVVLWSALISGYIELGLSVEALSCVDQMGSAGVQTDAVALVYGLKACANIQLIGRGQQIHAEATAMALERDVYIGSALVIMYSSCGLLAEARVVFDKLQIQDVVSWTAMITGYAEHGHDEEALDLFDKMQLEGLPPNDVTFVYGLKACTNIGTISKGLEMYAEIIKEGYEGECAIGSAVIDLYGKCGLLLEAKDVFDELQLRDVVTWNTLLAGYARQGMTGLVFDLFEDMREDGFDPVGVTFVNMVTVCSHAGFIDKGLLYFESMNKKYSIAPTVEHLNCMIDLLGRAGQLDEAVALLEKMPLQPDLVTWKAMLGACRKWGNLEMGRSAFQRALSLDKNDATWFALMSNIYADSNIWDESKILEDSEYVLMNEPS